MSDYAFDLVVKGGTLVSEDGMVSADVGVSDGIIASIGDLSSQAARETFDASGLHVLPGVIDSQVHFREPGNEHKEDLETGTRAALAGGVTTICEMPNTSPPTTSVAALEEKFRRAAGRAWCDHAFFAGATPDNAEALGELEQHDGCVGVKIFMGSSTGTLLVPDDAALERVLRATRRRVAVHCEDEARLNERKPLSEKGGVHQHPVWRDAECAFRATKRLVGLLQKTDRCAHVLHTTTAEEIAFLADKKQWTTVECTPQHLTLAAPDCYDRLGTYAQMNPPIRDASHREALWAGLREGVVDVIGSDHAPHTREEKDQDYPNTPSGMPGVQTLLPVMLDHVAAGRLGLERLVDLVCAGPARVWGMRSKGRVQVGFHADLTLVDLAAKRTITNDWIETRAGWTPFDGMEVTGWPMATVLRGEFAMRDGELIGPARGKPVQFNV